MPVYHVTLVLMPTNPLECHLQGGVPGYCGDRYFKAFAGGESVCAKFEKQGS
jgi:hypothetical protein